MHCQSSTSTPSPHLEVLTATAPTTAAPPLYGPKRSGVLDSAEARARWKDWVPEELLEMAPQQLRLSAQHLSVARCALYQAVSDEALFPEQVEPARKAIEALDDALHAMHERARLNPEPCGECGRSARPHRELWGCAPPPCRTGFCASCGCPESFGPDRACALSEERGWASMTASELAYLLECRERAARGGQLLSLGQTLGAIAEATL